MLESFKTKRSVVGIVVVLCFIFMAILWLGYGKDKSYTLPSSSTSANENDVETLSGLNDEKLVSIFQAVKKTADSVGILSEDVHLLMDDLKSRNVASASATAHSSSSTESVVDSHGLSYLSLNLDDVQLIDPVTRSNMHDKWIVVTSIFSPTEDMKKLAAIPGWKMVVVGDSKTPKDWSLDGVTFLSINQQEISQFETVKFLKKGVYQRKNMGYLYAIQHGAKYIYDTDDDNHPYGGQVIFDDLKVDKEYLVYDDGRNYYNTFAHFGQSSIWPRGYPLNHIAKSVATKYRNCTNVRPLVQQGVVDGDPDIDAIQRLTRKDIDVKFDVLFDKSAPPVILPDRSFAPYNSQNTIHLYDAFFALLLPQTVTFRVNDIWRSYIAQRLLWDIGGHLAYYPPSAYQDRTPHDFLQDFIEEDDLYKKCLPLTNFLLAWDSKEVEMHKRYFELVKELHALGVLGDLDVNLARAWIRDLVRIGYDFPPLRPSTMKCSKKQVNFVPNEQGSMYLRVGRQVVDIYRAAKEQATMEKAAKEKAVKEQATMEKAAKEQATNERAVRLLSPSDAAQESPSANEAELEATGENGPSKEN